MASLRPKHLRQLAKQDWLVVENFLPEKVGESLVEDLEELRSLGKFAVAEIGHDGQIQDEVEVYRDIRRGETCTLGRQRSDLPSSATRESLYSIMDELREDLDDEDDDTGAPLLDPNFMECMYAYYPKGGYYRRHRDAEAGSVSSIRQYSFLLFLNPHWKASDGGYLRIHCDGHGDHLPAGVLPNYREIAPKMGTLVVFKSDKIPHEVLDTHATRRGIVGWFLSPGAIAMDNNNAANAAVAVQAPTKINGMDVATLDALKLLRDTVPSMRNKLLPTTTTTTTTNANASIGILGMFLAEEETKIKEEEEETPEPQYKDTDQEYWSKICAFDENGFITTLSLGGQRLHRITADIVLKPPFFTCTNLQLGSSDVPLTILCEWIQRCGPNLKSLHLGANAMGDEGTSTLMTTTISTLQNLRSLDLRYNDISSIGAKAIADVLKRSDSCLEILYLEGNDLGDDGVKALAQNGTHTLLELFLGQNKIGPKGATSLAKGLKYGRLKKLYLEGNQIGPEGAKAFRNALDQGKGENKKLLEKLYVDNNGIGKQEAMALGQSLDSATMIGDGGLFQE